MLLKQSICTLFSIVVLFSVMGVSFGENFWDDIPVVSQAKSAIKLISGDKDGATNTHKNFLNQAPVISQIKSLSHVIHGDLDAAQRTQEQFFGATIGPVVDHFNNWLRLGLRDTRRMTSDPMPTTAVEHFQRNFNMTESYVRLLEPIDFLYVNDLVGYEDCYICTLAALKNKTVTNLVREMRIDPITEGENFLQVVDLYRRAGFEDVSTISFESIVDFKNYSTEYVATGECAKFTLAYKKRSTGNSASTYSSHYQFVYARIFKITDDEVRYLTTDFRELPFAKRL